MEWYFRIGYIFVILQRGSNISIWQKLRCRRAATLSLYTIAAAFLLAIFAYALAPDESPNANRALKELSAKHSGFSALFLKQPLPEPAHTSSPIKQFFAGSPPAYKLIPISSFFFARDTIVAEHYLGAGRGETLSVPLRTLLPAMAAKRNLGQQQVYIFNHNISRHTFILGTDANGRDILSRLLVGTRVSLTVGLVAVLLSLPIALLLGTLAGYYRGWLSALVRYVMDVLGAIPVPLLAFAITLCIGRGLVQVCLAIGLIMWVSSGRLIRNRVEVLKEKDYVHASRMLGLSRGRILLRHVVPELGPLLLALAASGFANAILIEAGLSFLGIGIQEPVPSWGLMVREGFLFMGAAKGVLLFVPGLAVVMLGLAFNTLSRALRDVTEMPD